MARALGVVGGMQWGIKRLRPVTGRWYSKAGMGPDGGHPTIVSPCIVKSAGGTDPVRQFRPTFLQRVHSYAGQRLGAACEISRAGFDRVIHNACVCVITPHKNNRLVIPRTQTKR